MGRDALGQAGPALTDQPPHPNHIRAFFAIPLPEAARVQLSEFTADCVPRAPEFRWVGSDNLHLTLRFLGWVEESLALEISRRVGVQHLPAITVQVGGIGTFGRGRHARVVWLGVIQGAAALVELAGVIETQCRGAGLEGESRPYSPHLTLARAREQRGATLPELGQAPELPPWVARELVLFRSHLGRAGAVYEDLLRLPLAGARGSQGSG